MLLQGGALYQIRWVSRPCPHLNVVVLSKGRSQNELREMESRRPAFEVLRMMS